MLLNFNIYHVIRMLLSIPLSTCSYSSYSSTPYNYYDYLAAALFASAVCKMLESLQ
jgi:hypothetical protein